MLCVASLNSFLLFLVQWLPGGAYFSFPLTAIYIYICIVYFLRHKKASSTIAYLQALKLCLGEVPVH
jgi:hypothetical protein